MTRQFPLAGLLRVRALAEERAAGELAAARRAERAAAERARETRERLAGASMPDVADDLAFRASVASRATLAALLHEHDADVQVAQSRTEDRTGAWTAARREARAVERLEERHDATVRAEELHAEQVVLDEVGGRRAAREDA
ncbi:flagellar FliJ family protein [Cellulomonas fimi]|uniref:Flagellar FliJ protein n=1 Tax=Cellulomonas fimi (strain ATCC 484 / DSM 20113 / JCM 1341 / CCUG 24087 / LMG 16345 / NBRC 15513 / NCIMB 8980 / NCTC 7547 / NRS-133) TaxID=590998 RepID=F4GYU6_CELFA|nr:flagellar FliJ family protein [Cellulomonas fimi]AEE44815.1 flagellar export FliJ family protein [Cellulomonas fimi ATCC 484]NNH08369.1 flagellar export protein FliJ [Cellulomonas fimi]VEH27371.1 flagellar export protein FliJ [Cellulomonas fimi]